MNLIVTVAIVLLKLYFAVFIGENLFEKMWLMAYKPFLDGKASGNDCMNNEKISI